MNKVNLMDKLIADPFTIEPWEAKSKNRKVWKTIKNKPRRKKREIVTRVMCGCGNHPINPKKDPYTQHNKWAAQFHPGKESGRTDIRNVKGVGVSADQIKPTYDFSGEEFEMSDAELRKFNGK